MATTSKAIICTAVGEVEIQDVPIPKGSSGYTVFRTKAVALNPTDWKSIHFKDGGAVGTRPGVDFAGVVEEVGSKETRPWKKGDRVLGGVYGARDAERGAFGEYVVAKGGLYTKIPDNLSFEEAATLAVGVTTCGQALYQFLKLPLPLSSPETEETILIYGGSTSTGVLGIQYAKLSGLRVLTTSSPHNYEYVKSMGADEVFDHNGDLEELASKINTDTNNKLTLAWDCRPTANSGRFCAHAMSSSKKGVYCSIQPGTRSDSLKEFNKMVDAGFTIGYTAFGETFTRAGRTYEAKDEDVKFAESFWEITHQLLEEEKLRVANIKVDQGGNGLEGVIAGLEYLRQGKVSGAKLVYRI